jgi:predicted GTPase
VSSVVSGAVGAVKKKSYLKFDLCHENKCPCQVVIMGETGCGKSSLIRNLCAIIGAVLRTLNIHGGMDDQTIVSWMQREVIPPLF